ncbi:MAG TPA: endonuclease/exonuclease/phosphatase family protein, partial [Thermomicrobiales bacterium]|nr:endonuclease/exonuclease/phosphatase family protein [Thermomicrobiales bacterium]
MKLYSWNVNGIRAAIKSGSLQEMIATHAPDVLCLQEVKAGPHQVTLDLPDYSAYWNPADKAGYSGTAIFSRVEALTIQPGLPADLVEQFGLADDPFGNPNAEGRVI